MTLRRARLVPFALAVLVARIVATAARTLLEASVRTYDETQDALVRELVRLPRMLLVDAVLLVVGGCIFFRRGARGAVTSSILAWSAWVFVLSLFGVVHAVQHREAIGDVHRLAQLTGVVAWLVVIVRRSKQDELLSRRARALLAITWAFALAIIVALEGTRVAQNLAKLRGVPIDSAAPDFTVRTLAGASIELHALRGRVVFVEFWATWCGPCRETLPELAPLRARFASRDVTFVAIEIDGDAPNSARIASGLGVPYDIVALGREEISQSYRVDSYPHAVLVGRDGRIVRAFRGVYSEDEIARAIERAE